MALMGHHSYVHLLGVVISIESDIQTPKKT